MPLDITKWHETKSWNSYSRIFFKIGVLTNLSNFTGKHLCWSLETPSKCFPVKFTEFLRTPFFTEHLRWLLLKISLIQIIFQFSLQLQISKVDNIYIDLLPRCCHLPNFFKGAEVANGVFFKKGVLKNFANFTGKHRCQSLFEKVAGLQACQTCNFIKKRLQHRCFPMKLAKFLRTPILKNICKRLFLQKPSSPLYPEHFKY